MNIGIIGAGHIGGTLAKLFIGAGHHVLVSNSRGPETLTELVSELGPRARAGTAEEAAAFGEVTLEAIPYGRFRELPRESLAGKLLISASNYYEDRDGPIDLGDDAQTELLAKAVPEATVVKAFNTIYYKDLASQGDTSAPEERRRAIFVAGDDPRAKERVAELVRQIGFGAVDAGSLHHSKVLEPGSKVYTKQLTVLEGRAALAAS